MPRPPKKGLEWFKKDTNYYEDDRIIDLLNEYGPLGNTIYDVILTMVYTEGYYLEIPKERLVQKIIRQIGNRWVNKKDLVWQVVCFCADIGLLHDGLLRHGIITSAGIQRRYAAVTGRNKVNKDHYWLLDESPESDTETETGVSATETQENAPDMQQEKSREDIPPLTPPGGEEGKPKKNGGRERRVYAHDDRYYRCAVWLDEDIAKQTPDAKRAAEPQLQQWADKLRLMEERDKIPFDVIGKVLLWARKDQFWSTVVMSTGSLRDNFNKILAKMKAASPDKEEGEDGRWRKV